MSFLGNVLWFIFGGLFSGLSWILSGVIWCITIVGIPYGKQCFKFASMSFAPFGKEIEYGGGVPSLLANVIWIIFFGIPMALENLIFGCIWCITIVVIPFGLQFFKIAKFKKLYRERYFKLNTSSFVHAVMPFPCSDSIQLIITNIISKELATIAHNVIS